MIHTDFERGFIRAQTIAFDDYVACKGEQGAKDAGQDALRRQGVRRQGRRRAELPVQRLIAAAKPPPAALPVIVPGRPGLSRRSPATTPTDAASSAGSMSPMTGRLGPPRPALRADAARLRRRRQPRPLDRDPAGLRLAALPGRRHRPGERAGLRPADAGRGGARLVLRQRRAGRGPGRARADRLRPAGAASPSRRRCRRPSVAALVRRLVRQPLTLTLPARRRPLHGRLLRRQPGRADPGHGPARTPPASSPSGRWR